MGKRRITLDDAEAWVHSAVPSAKEIEAIRKRFLQGFQKDGGYVVVPTEWIRRIQQVIAAEHREGPRKPGEAPTASSVARRRKATCFLGAQLRQDFVNLSIKEDLWWEDDRNSQAREICCEFFWEIADAALSTMLLLSRAISKEAWAEAMNAIDRLVESMTDEVHERHAEMMAKIIDRYGDRLRGGS